MDKKDKILIVDDEFTVIELLERVLKEARYDYVSATTSEKALELLADETFDLVLLDVKMPHISGIEILKRIKASYPHTSVIMMTGFVSTETAIESLRNGAYDYVTKPFNFDELVLILKNCLEHNRLRRQETIFRETTHLYQLAQELTKIQSEKNLLQSILECTVKTLTADAGSIFMYVPEKHELVSMAAIGHKHNMEMEIKVGEKVVGWVAEKQQPLLIQNGFRNQPQFKDFPVRREIVSSMIAPLMNQDALLGVVCLDRFVNQTDYEFTHHDLESLQFFALHATLIVTTLRQHQALKQLDELKSEFIANVSHELRTPLMAITGAVELLNSSASVNASIEKTKMFHELINRNADRMGRLVNELLDYSRIETKRLKLHTSTFDLKALIDESLQDFELSAKEKRITLSADCPCPVTAVYADRERVKQLVTNLINNAIKFTPEEGAITVNYKDDDKEHILITVADTGIGIPEDQLGKIFDKFYQVDGSAERQHAGFGLGLAIVKSIVEAHNGTIRVESILSKGTTFFVRIPCLSPKPPDASTNAHCH